MADRELKRLSRRELLEMLIAQGRENERLQAEITRLEELLSEREIHLSESGNIAEAALRLNGVFEAAQRAAEQYLENISRGEITKALIGENGEFTLFDTVRMNAGEPAELPEDAAEGAPARKKRQKAPKQPKSPKQPKQPKRPEKMKRPKSAPLKLKRSLAELAAMLKPLTARLRRQK